MSMYVNEGFLRALKLHYESEVKRYQATLGLYLSQPAAIADHSNLMGDMKELTKSLAEAKDAFKTLEEYYPKSEEGGGKGKKS